MSSTFAFAATRAPFASRGKKQVRGSQDRYQRCA
jgi:hypothetical protein